MILMKKKGTFSRHKQPKKVESIQLKKSSIFAKQKHCFIQLFKLAIDIPGCPESPQQNNFRFSITKQN
jgi:hypothetical protein